MKCGLHSVETPRAPPEDSPWPFAVHVPTGRFAIFTSGYGIPCLKSPFRVGRSSLRKNSGKTRAIAGNTSCPTITGAFDERCDAMTWNVRRRALSRFISVAGFAVLLAPAVCVWAQTSDDRQPEHLQVSDIGEYRPEATADLTQARDEIIRQTNEFRKSEGREPTVVNEQLQKAAQQFASFMAENDLYGHTADERHPSDRAEKQGYEYCAIEENIAYEFRTTGFDANSLSKGFFEGWKNSPGHRENMLRPYVTETGVGLAQSKKTGVYYAVQMFGRPKSDMISFRVANQSESTVYYWLGEQRYKLPPRVIRTHQLCRPEHLAMRATDDQTAPPVAEIEPENGQHFIVNKNSEHQLRLEQANTDAGASGQ